MDADQKGSEWGVGNLLHVMICIVGNWMIKTCTMFPMVRNIGCFFVCALCCIFRIDADDRRPEPFLPAPENRGRFEQLDHMGFSNWKISKFDNWGGVADGGSILFDFKTDEGIEFGVLIANKGYWTDADKADNSQVICITKGGKIYILGHKNVSEASLLKRLNILHDSMVDDHRRASKKVLKILIDTIESRKPLGPDYCWPPES